MKKFLSSIIFVFFLLVMTVSQVHAQEPTLWDRFTGGVRNTFQRLYLKLPGEKAGPAVLNQMMLSLRDVKTAKVSGTVKVMADSNNANFSGEWTTTGVMEADNFYDYTTVRQQNVFNGTAQSEGAGFSVNGEMVQDGQTLYVKFSELPNLPMFNTARAKGVWIRMAGTEATPELTEGEQQQLRVAFEDLVRAADISSARREDLEGTPVFVIDLTFNEDDLATYGTRVTEIMDKEKKMTEEEKQQLREGLADMAPVTVTVYIDRNTYFMRRVVLPMTVSLAEVSDGEQQGTATINVDLRWSDINQPVVIDVPEESQDLNEIMGEVMPASMGGAVEMQLLQEKLKENQGKIPAELQGLSPEEKKLLREMGLEL